MNTTYFSVLIDINSFNNVQECVMKKYGKRCLFSLCMKSLHTNLPVNLRVCFFSNTRKTWIIDLGGAADGRKERGIGRRTQKCSRVSSKIRYLIPIFNLSCFWSTKGLRVTCYLPCLCSLLWPIMLHQNQSYYRYSKNSTSCWKLWPSLGEVF